MMRKYELPERVTLQSFSCEEELSKYATSMLVDSGTEIAKAVYAAGDNILTVTLEVCGEVAVDYKGTRYRSPSEFPDELKELIRKNPVWWDIRAPSGEGNDDPESDIYVVMSNWFEAIWEYRGSCDGVVYEQELATSSVDDVKEFLEEVALITIGEMDRDVLKSQMLGKAEELGWQVKDSDGIISFSWNTPEGENFWFVIEANSPVEIMEKVEEYYRDFDIKGHASFNSYVYEGNDHRDFLRDAEEISRMIENLVLKFSVTIDAWSGEYGIEL